MGKGDIHLEERLCDCPVEGELKSPPFLDGLTEPHRPQPQASASSESACGFPSPARLYYVGLRLRKGFDLHLAFGSIFRDCRKDGTQIHHLHSFSPLASQNERGQNGGEHGADAGQRLHNQPLETTPAELGELLGFLKAP